MSELETEETSKLKESNVKSGSLNKLRKGLFGAIDGITNLAQGVLTFGSGIVGAPAEIIHAADDKAVDIMNKRAETAEEVDEEAEASDDKPSPTVVDAVKETEE